METWRDIEGYNGLYQVSNVGNVKSLAYGRERILKPDLVKGYLRVTFSTGNLPKRFVVHRLVCTAFLPVVAGKNFVNHINGIKTDNRVENLEWCTISENESHAHRILNKTPPMAKKCINTNTGKVYSSISKAAIDIGMKPRTLLARVSGQNKFNDAPIQLI